MATQEKTFNKLRIVGIGSGNVATHLYRGLADVGHDIIQVYSRSIDSARILADQCNAEAINTLESIDPNADIYLISILDDAISNFAKLLCEYISDSGIIAHTTGSIHMQALKHSDNPIGVLYPLQTFNKDGYLDLSVIPFLLEAEDTQTMRSLKDLALSISNSFQYIDSEKRKHVHLAAVASCNFVNHLMSTAYEYLSTEGIDPQLLNPLMKETLHKFITHYPTDTQTGPAKRGDQGTITKHKHMLREHPMMQDLYSTITKQILNKYQ